MEIKNILFVCSRNKWRSPTGEKVWRRSGQYSTRSAGISPRAKRVITVNDVKWADLIFVMEHKHKHRLDTNFSQLLRNKKIVTLDIPDEYQFMDPELVMIFEELLLDY